MSAVSELDGTSPGPAAGLDPGEQGLDRRSANALEVFGQSLAATGPSIAVAGTIAVVYLSAGKGTIWSYVLATVVVVLVGLSIAQFARRTAGAGSLYTYTAAGLGRGPAFAGGWGLIFGYVTMGAACLAGAALYFGSFLSKFGLNALSKPWQLGLIVVFLILTAGLPVRGVHISTRVSIVLEIISVLAIGVLLVALLLHHGFSIDTSQLKASGSNATGIALGTVLAVGAFCGFENSASLGIEARSPHRAIPRAVLLTVVGAGVLYIIAAYAQVLGFGSAASLAQSSAPLNDLASSVGLGWLAYALDLAIAVSAAAVVSACFNAAARAIYSLGRENVLPTTFGSTHSKYKTPHVAIYALAPVLGVIPFAMTAYGTTPLNIFGYVGTIAVFGYLLAYVLVAISAPIFLHRRNALSAWPVIVSVLTTLTIGYVIYKNLIPVPPGPYNLFPYIFTAWIVIGLAWYFVVKVRNPERAARLGSLTDQESADLEARIAAELAS